MEGASKAFAHRSLYYWAQNYQQQLKKMAFEAKEGIDALESWCCYFKNEGYLKEDEMPILLKDNQPIQKAHRLYEQFAADSAKLAMLEAREKWVRDHLSQIDDSLQEGLEKGREEGYGEKGSGNCQKTQGNGSLFLISLARQRGCQYKR